MKIAVFGDSKVSEDQHKLALKYNPNLSQQDIDNTWINRLTADGHTVDVFSRMSCDNHWINTKWQDMYNRADDRNKSYYGYDRWIIRPAPVNSLPFNVSDEDFNKWHSDIWQDLGVQFSGSSDHRSVLYYKLWHEFTPKRFKVDIWKTYMFNWTYDKHTVLVINSEQDRLDIRNNYLFLESHWQTERLKPKMHLIEWKTKFNSLAEEKREYLKGFKERHPDKEFYIDRKNTARLFHKHLNHNTAKTHEEIYKYVKDWMLYNKKPEFIETDAFGQYEWPCPVLKEIEDEITTR